MMMNCAWNGDSDWGNESGSLFQNGLCTLRYILISTWYISMDRAVSDFKAGGCGRLSKSDNRWGTTDTRKSAAGFSLNVTGMAFDRRYRYFATEDTAVQHNASSFRISRGMPSTSVSTPRNPRGFCHSRAALYSSDVVLETRVLVSRRLEYKNESLGLGSWSWSSWSWTFGLGLGLGESCSFSRLLL